MQQLKIYNAQNQAIELPRTKKISMGGALVATEVEMVSGRRVQYVQGFRPSFTAEWEWFPNDLLAELTALLRQGGFFPTKTETIKAENSAFPIPRQGYLSLKTANRCGTA